MVLAVLAIVWIVVLGSYARERFGGRHHDSVSAFHTQLSTLQRTQPGGRSSLAARTPDVRPRTRTSSGREAARIRRRNILFGLFGAVVTTALLAFAAPSAGMIGLNVVCVLAFAAYVALLVNQQRLVTEQRVKVRRIHPQVPSMRRTPDNEVRPGLAAVARYR